MTRARKTAQCAVFTEERAGRPWKAQAPDTGWQTPGSEAMPGNGIITHYALSITHLTIYLLPPPSYLLPERLLPTAYCLLPIPYSLPIIDTLAVRVIEYTGRKWPPGSGVKTEQNVSS